MKCRNPPCHMQMPTNALLWKKEAICEHDPEVPSCPVGQCSFKMDCFKVEKCYMVRRVQIWHSCWKSRMPCPPGLRGGRPSLACFGRHYEFWKVYKGFRETNAPLQVTSISWNALCISKGQCKTAAITTAWLHSRRVKGAELTCL